MASFFNVETVIVLLRKIYTLENTIPVHKLVSDLFLDYFDFSDVKKNT